MKKKQILVIAKRCAKCGHAWHYKGQKKHKKKYAYTSCPKCKSHVNLNR